MKEELARQEPVIIRDERLQVEWVAYGKYPLVISPKSDPVAEFMKAGAPVSLVTPSEGGYLTGGASYISLVNRAPHPNAVAVFVNWFLGKESGELLSRAALRQSARNDDSSEELPPDNVREPGVKYFNAEQEELLKKEVQRMEVAREIFEKFVR